MDETGRELTLDDLPRPPLFKLVDPEGRDVLQETEVGGQRARRRILRWCGRARDGKPLWPGSKGALRLELG
jgi:hypothetical protein